MNMYSKIGEFGIEMLFPVHDEEQMKKISDREQLGKEADLKEKRVNLLISGGLRL